MAERPAKGKLRLRCAIYTRKSSEEGLEQSSTRSTPNVTPARHLSLRNGMKDGPCVGTATMMAAYRAARWSGPRFSGS
jgi:hypothetical protein